MARQSNIKLRRSATQGSIPTTSNLDLGELAINTYDGKLYVKKTFGSIDRVVQVGSSSYSYNLATGVTETLKVTVASTPSDHRYNGTGSSNKYFINGLPSPYLKLIPGVTYTFDQSDSSNSGHPFRFYYEANKTTAYTTGVTTSGTPGSSGAYTQIIATDSTPSVLHYQCTAHGYMGNQAEFSTRNLTGYDTDDLTEGSSNLYYTSARANSDFDTRFATKDTGDLTEGSNLYHTTNRARNAISAGTGISYNSSTGVITNTITQYADSDARSAISVTDAGGDGSLAYNSSTGVITYTGPSASEVRAHFSAGTGVTLSSGQISIGQAVATTSNVQFNNIQVDGTLTSDDITSTNISIAGNATITGNLTVQGTTTTVDSNTVNIGDNIIVLNADETGTPSQDGGIEIERGTSTNKTFVWDETNDRWTLGTENLVAGTFIGNLTGDVTGDVTGTVSSLSNHDTGDLSEGSNLYYTNARADARITAASIGDLSDVDITTSAPTSNQVLKWNGTNFVPGTDLSGSSASDSFTTIAVSGQSNVVADSSTDTLTLIAGTGMTISTSATNDEITFASTATGTVTETFKTLAVSGQNSIVADSATDTLTFAAGSGITLTTDDSTDTLTITSTGGSSSSQSAIWKEYVYTATSNQTTFSGSDDNSQTLSYVPTFLQVYLNGVLLENGTDYTATSSTSVVLVNGANTGDTLQVATFVKIFGTGDMITDTFTGNGSTAAYTLTTDPSTEDNTIVFVDGVYQEKDTYTVSGTTLTFDANVPNGASIEVVIGSRNITVDEVADLTLEGDLSLVDNKKAFFGTGKDLEIYHDGTNSIIEDAGTGHVQVRSGTFTVGNAALTKVSAVFNSGSSQDFYYDNVKKLETTSAGATVTGDLVISGDLTVQGTNTTLNTATLDVEDLNITVGSGATSSSAADGAGLTFGDYTGKATFTWDDSETSLITNTSLSVGGSNNELRFYEGTNYVGFEAPALSANQIWVLPDSDGTSGYALKTDGSGNLSWGLAGGNAFETIAVSGQSNIVAASSTDTLTIAAGSGITLTTNASTDTLTIANSSLGANAFGNIAVSGQTTVAADSTGDTLTLVGQNGVDITTDASNDTVTIDGRTSYSTFTTDLFTGNNSDVDFVLSSTPSSEDNLIVFLEGVYQNKNSYSLSGSTITMSGTPGTGEELIVHQVSDIISGQALVRNNFTGVTNQTDFTLTLAPMNANNTFVYMDGVYQEKSEYTVSGTTLSFTTAPTAGDSIEVIIPKATEINQPATASIDDIAMFDDTAIIGNTLTSTTLTTTSASTIATHAIATYRSVNYQIQCTQGTDYHITNISVVHDGTTAHFTEYGAVFDNASLGTFDATISGGNLLLQITPGSATNMAVKVVSSAIPV